MKLARLLLVSIAGDRTDRSRPGAAAHAQVPADDVEVILAVDTSGSMRPAIESAKAAATEFVASMPADVRIGVETFSDTVTVLTAPTTDRVLLVEQIDSITTGGDTALFDVVVGASQHFTPDRRAQGARPAVGRQGRGKRGQRSSTQSQRPRASTSRRSASPRRRPISPACRRSARSHQPMTPPGSRRPSLASPDWSSR